ncbi:MAG: alginate export family protein [Deltaproteobacteria bacterium]|nr:alginate export family protein [Candidatus Anaeroferrophillus wilburensis]MBN2888606.1 alginate export family protein [Deltaproteobacteria bacterium]
MKNRVVMMSTAALFLVILLTLPAVSFAYTFLDCGVCSSRKAAKEKAEKDKLTFGMETRLRYEYLDNINFSFYGDNPPAGAGTDGFLTGRVRAGIDYRPVERIHIALWGAYADAWDYDSDELFDNKRTSRYKEDPDLYLAYVEFENILDQDLNIKLGRQRLDYGDFRVLGLCDWVNTGPYLWDAVLVSKRFPNGFVDMFYGRTVYQDEHEFSLNRRHWYEGAGVYSHWQLPKGMPYIAFEPFYIMKWDDHENYNGGAGDLDDQYLGMRSYGRDLAGFDYDLLYARESGDMGGLDIDAYHFNVRVGYRFAMLPWSPRLSFGYTVSSGNDSGTADFEQYQTAFGVWGAAYGQEYNMFSFKNFEDYQLSLELKPLEPVKVELHYHDYKLHESGDSWRSLANDGTLGDDVGDVFELEVRYALSDTMSIGLQAGMFVPGDYAKDRTGFDDEATWILLDWDYRFDWKLL